MAKILDPTAKGDNWQPPLLPPLVTSKPFLTRRQKRQCVEWDHSPSAIGYDTRAQRRISVCWYLDDMSGFLRVSEGDFEQGSFRHIKTGRFKGADQLETMLLDAFNQYFTVVRNPTVTPVSGTRH